VTRKDYVAIARAFHECKPLDNGTGVKYAAEKETWESIMMEVANVFAEDNARFEVKRFFAACNGGK
jgi:hypothetical protein